MIKYIIPLCLISMPSYAAQGNIEATIVQIVPANDDGICPDGTSVMYDQNNNKVCVR